MNNELGNHRVPGRTLLASTVLIAFATVNRIVEAAGISQPALYHHFESKNTCTWR